VHMLIDTHAHLDEIADLDGPIADARAAGVVAVVAVGSGRESNEKTLEISRKHHGFVYPALGLHPWQLAGLGVSDIDDNVRWIDRNAASAVAIGEIGLDYHKRVLKVASKEIQMDVFSRLLEVAKRCSKPAIIHSRYAWKDALLLAQEAGIDKAVFHWFTGFSSVLKDIIAGGFLLSATPAAEYHEEHRRAIREAPLHALLLETDCPVTYGRTVRYESRPADVLRSLLAAASIRGEPEAAIAEQTTRNAVDFFCLDLAQ
jgi:TatD DNase family protein